MWKVVPLSVIIGGGTYHDGQDIDQAKLFSLIQEAGELPKTAAPSIGEFHKMFDGPDESIFIGISSQLSATVQNAQISAQDFPEGKVRVIDSLNLSSGTGLLALAAADLRGRGLTAAEIETEIRGASAQDAHVLYDCHYGISIQRRALLGYGKYLRHDVEDPSHHRDEAGRNAGRQE